MEYPCSKENFLFIIRPDLSAFDSILVVLIGWRDEFIDSNTLHYYLIRRGETNWPPLVILSASEG
ncbi:MAG: hypothetical protein ACXWPS_19945 [Ktedonobacteraceae bacterium]